MLTISNQIKSNQIIIYSRYRDTTYCNTNVLAGEPSLREVDRIRVVPLTYTKSTLKNIYQTSVPEYMSICSFNLLLKSESLSASATGADKPFHNLIILTKKEC
jgi:hypothetical protein